MNGDIILLLILAVLILIIAAILFWPRRPTYTHDVTSTRNSYERGFGDW
ncbi:MAG: hypothetical protein L0332_15520 [Chloroflexi bacterium]|nr:hypothetical protein [Chloroflexota bacterium]MCI0648938.1 hypothetical protein [Chloroflexota bacterium]MCI0728112.1 hypothetical protein [Chloroflexota bacterium]